MLVYFQGPVRGPLGNALMVSHRGPKTTDSAMQSSRGRLWPSFTGMENCRVTYPQGLAGTSGDRKPWSVPICLVPASMMPLPLVPGRGWRRVPVRGLLLLPASHRDHAFRRTLDNSCVLQNLRALCWNVDQAHLDPFWWPLSPRHNSTAPLGPWCRVGLARIRLFLCSL